MSAEGPKANPALLIILGLLIVALTFAWLIKHRQNNPPPPYIAIPDVSTVVGVLRQAKVQAEGYASSVKEELRRKRLSEGRKLYADAAASHNRAISEIQIAMELPAGAWRNEKLDSLLADARKKRDTFYGWCESATKRRRPSAYGEAGSAEAAPNIDIMDLCKLILDLQKLDDEQAARQRAILREEIRKCEWSSWDSLR